ncbi:TPA: DUF6631 family protein [Serratia marcescens]
MAKIEKARENLAQTSDLTILLSTRDIDIGAERLTIREYTLHDSLELYEAISPVAADLAAVMDSESIVTEQVRAVLARHYSLMPLLIARTVDRSPEWVAGLPADYGLVLMDWWWSLNRSFFIGAAVQKLRAMQAERNSPSGTA